VIGEVMPRRAADKVVTGGNGKSKKRSDWSGWKGGEGTRGKWRKGRGKFPKSCRGEHLRGNKNKAERGIFGGVSPSKKTRAAQTEVEKGLKKGVG